MTRKHFKAIADALASSKPSPSNIEALQQWRIDVAAITNTLKQFNDNFDTTKFITACGEN